MRNTKYTPIIGNKYNDWEVISDEKFNRNSNRATYWKVRLVKNFNYNGRNKSKNNIR